MLLCVDLEKGRDEVRRKVFRLVGAPRCGTGDDDHGGVAQTDAEL